MTFKLFECSICRRCPAEFLFTTFRHVMQGCSNVCKVFDESPVVRRYTNECPNISEERRDRKVTHRLDFRRVRFGSSCRYNVAKKLYRFLRKLTFVAFDFQPCSTNTTEHLFENPLVFLPRFRKDDNVVNKNKAAFHSL